MSATPSPPATTGFLIVDGARVVALDKPVVNIGRKGNNHIIINDPHVSRHHAQIRQADGRYLLIDLNSTVGTSVNGERVEHAFLKSGDVISIGGVPLIFGQGTASGHLIAENLHQPSSSTGPTDTTEIRDLDDYLDFFTPPDDDYAEAKR